MNVALCNVRERVSRPREHLIANRLQRFAWRHREAVSKMAGRHPRLADLALSFPALLFAVTVPRPRFDPDPVIERVMAGAPLKELAVAASIPVWTRKLPPETFLFALPASLPDGDLFRRQVGNNLPRRPRYACRWLHYVWQVSIWGSDQLALWFAARIGSDSQTLACANWRLLCLWAWHSEKSDMLASRFVTTRWTPAMSTAQAVLAAQDWEKSVEVGLHLTDEPIVDMWAEPATVDGYEFVPLRTASALNLQARSMNNCARSYADAVGTDRSRIWVMRKNGHDISMVELAVGYRSPLSRIAQIHGSSNTKVTEDQWLAAMRWHHIYGDHKPRFRPKENLDSRTNWVAMWRPYWLSKGRIPAWLPLSHRRNRWPLPAEKVRY